MKKTILILMLALLGLQAQAQVKGVMRLTYGTEDPGTLIHDLQGVYQNPSVDFIRNCNFGLGMRVGTPVGFYGEIDAVISLNAIWDSVSAMGNNFVEHLGNTFRYTQSMSLSVPVYFGWQFDLAPKIFDVRVFLGPEFYSTVFDATNNKSFDFNTFSATLGVGFDLLDKLTVDAKATYLAANELRAPNLDKSKLFYSASVGLLF